MRNVAKAAAVLGLWVGTAASAQTAPAQVDASQPATEAERMRADALAVVPLLTGVYAYRDRFPDGIVPTSERLRGEAERVNDRRSLLRYAERALLALADHHAITGASFADSWAVVPTFADLWIQWSGGRFVVDAVRQGSPAAAAGIRPGDVLTGVGGVPAADAAAAFWADLGLEPNQERLSFAARVLAAGRRDQPRRLTFGRVGAGRRSFELPSLYSLPRPDRAPVDLSQGEGRLLIRFNDSLGEGATVAAFDAAMRSARPGERIVIDLRDTPSGGNTTVARAILGWFVNSPAAYQVHSLPAEEMRTGVPRMWIEMVLPREGGPHDGPVEVLVGRWTGSMGEGLAIGFDALGATVRGGPMAGLLGAIYDHRLEHSGLVLKVPTERLMTTGFVPRELFVPGRRSLPAH